MFNSILHFIDILWEEVYQVADQWNNMQKVTKDKKKVKIKKRALLGRGVNGYGKTAENSRAPDSGTTDSETTDSRTAGSGTADSGASDIGTVDNGTADSGTADSRTTQQQFGPHALSLNLSLGVTPSLGILLPRAVSICSER